MNTKSFFLFCAIAILSVACAPDTSYTIYGTVDLNDTVPIEGKIYLKKRQIREWITVDSAEIVNSTFEFSGVADTISVLYCELEGARRTPLVLEPGNITVAMSDISFQVTGTPQNDDLSEFYDQMSKQQDKIELKFRQEVESGLAESVAMNTVQPLLDSLKQYQVDFIIANINREISNFVFTGIYYQLNVTEKENIISKMTEKSRSFDRIPMIIKALELEKKTTVGQSFTDLAYPNPAGEIVKLSDLVGKTDYVLVDFWASWCPPCVRSFPELTSLYEKYKSTGKLEILGVSLDMKHSNWTDAIEKYNLTWKHLSDVKGWECEAAQKYAVNSIPTTILIDKEGKIVSRNITHSELEELLK